jgi:pheromone shutdown protein TraB
VTRILGGRVIFFGTAHGLQKIIDLVDQFIRTEQPDLVLVELEHLAFSVWNPLIDKHVDSPANLDTASFLAWRSSIESKIREKRFQLPKGEMVQAIQTSKELSIPWEIIDLPIEEIARVAGARESELESLSVDNLQHINGDFLDTYIATAARFAQFVGLIDAKKTKDPAIGERILDARNDYMAQKITACLAELYYRKILVVCGNAHVVPLIALVNKD